MSKLSACIEMLFTEVDFLDRPAAAAACGLPAVEFWMWAGRDLPPLVAACQDAGVAIAGCCVDTRNPSHKESFGRWGILDRRNHDVFLDMVKESIDTLRPLGIRTMIATVGQELPLPRFLQHASIVDCLAKAAPLLTQAGMTLVVEPLNPMVNHRGYYLGTSYEGFDIMRQVDAPSVRLLYDIYHQQVTEGNLIDNITANAPLIGHVHAADVPGRNQPGTGEIHYGRVLRALDATGYSGYVGLEYRPHGCTTAESLCEILAIAADVGGA